MIRNTLKKLLGGNYTENNEKLAILNFAIVILMFVVSGIMLFVLPPEISILQSGGTYYPIPSVLGVWLFPVISLLINMLAFVISAAIHVIPIMLPISETSALYRIIVLMPLFYSQYISIMSVEQMHNGMLYAVWSIPVAIALVVIGSIISHKAFSKHQVR